MSEEKTSDIPPGEPSTGPLMEYADPKRLPPESRAQQSARSGATWLWQTIVGLVAPGMVGMLAAVAIGPVVGPMFAMLAAVIMFVMGRTATNARRQRSMVLLAYVEQAVRLNLPLVQTLRAWSAGEQPRMAKVLLRAADALEDGGAVAESVAYAAPMLPRRAYDLLVTAERNGKLAPAMTDLLRDESIRPIRDPTHWPLVKLYSIIVLLAVTGTVWMLVIFVMPKFQVIFKDFHTPLPAVTQLMISFAQVLSPVASLAGAVLLIIACRSAVDELFRRGARRHKSFIANTIDRLRWMIPFVHGLDRDRGLADVCAVIETSLESHRPLPSAVAEARQPHVNAVLVERVAAWAEGLDEGLTVGDAARRARMPQMIWGLIGTDRQPPDLVAVFRFLSRYYGARFSRAEILLREAAVPALALGGGLLVAFVALSIFEPMMSLIFTVSGHMPRHL